MITNGKLNAVKMAIKKNAMDTETLHHNQVMSSMNVTHNIVRTLANLSEKQYE